jgi:hypothetical protein
MNVNISYAREMCFRHTHDGQAALELADAKQKTDAGHAVQSDCVGHCDHHREKRSLGNEGGANGQGNGCSSCRRHER